MAASKLIRDLPNPPKRTIRIVLFGAEEIGSYGGNYSGEQPRDELSKHSIAVEADAGQGPVHTFNIGIGNPLDPSLSVIRKALEPLGVKAGRAKSRGGPDIAPMSNVGVPVVGLDMFTEDYFDLHHTANDTIDKIVPERINQSAAVYVTFAYLASELGATIGQKTSACLFCLPTTKATNAKERPAADPINSTDRLFLCL